MPDYCDRSPCSKLIAALGVYVFGDPVTGEYKILVYNTGSAPRAIGFDYCPFCGTRVDNLETVSTGKIIYLPES